MKKISFAFLCLVILFSACKKEADQQVVPPLPKNDIQTGSRFVYTLTNLNENGVAINSFNIIWVAEEQIISGSKWLVMIDQSSKKPKVALQKRDDGWWYMDYPNPNPSLVAKDPAAVNDEYPINNWNHIVYTGKVKAVNFSINVLGVVYTDATHIEAFEAGKLRTVYYYHPDFIMVKVDTYMDKSTGGTFLSQTVNLKSLIK